MKHFLKAAALALSASTVLVQPAAARTDATAHRLTETVFRVSFDPHLNTGDLIGETSITERAPVVQVAYTRKRSRRMRTKTMRRPVAKPRRIRNQMTSIRKRQRNGTTSPTNGNPVLDLSVDFSP